MRAFVCAKCETDQVNIKYCWQVDEVSKRKEEGLLCRCDRCGYRWIEASTTMADGAKIISHQKKQSSK